MRLLLILFGACLWSQTLTLTGPSSIQAGQSAAVSLNCTGCTGANIRALQADIPSSGLAGLSCVPTAQLAAASKFTTCAANGQAFRLVTWGRNTLTIPDGPIASYSFRVPARYSTRLALSLSNLQAVTTGGTFPNLTTGPVVLHPGPTLTIYIGSPIRFRITR